MAFEETREAWEQTQIFNIYNAPAKTCPVCRDTYLAPVAVGVICGDTRHTITGKHDVETTLISPISGRGVLICREYVCEAEGHRWREVEQFHKGETFADTVIIPSGMGPLGVIWRD